MVLHCEIKPDYVLDDNERNRLMDSYSEITANPYRHYTAFVTQVADIIAQKKVPDSLRSVCKEFFNSDAAENPFIFVKNVPFDEDVKPFDNHRALHDKYEHKKTFHVEATLTLLAKLLNQTPIGYLNVNGGDVFQDIYPLVSLKDTQSQKALGPIYFHKDLANHYVRPDYVNMIGMRHSVDNEIYTTFVRNLDIYNALTESELQMLKMQQFYTPFDDLTTLTGAFDVGEADVHPVLCGDFDIRFFENRTRGVTEEAQRMVVRLAELLHMKKYRVQMQAGDFIGVRNNYSMHGKEIGVVKDPDAVWHRWSMKTVNVDSISDHASHLVRGSDYLIAG